MADETETRRPAPARRGRGALKLNALAPKLLAPVLAKRGFANADLTVHWPEIVGPGVARASRPLSMAWPKGGPENGAGATLTVAASGAFALDLQQMAPVILERINRRLGWRCVAQLRIRQMPVKPPAEKPQPRTPSPADLAEAGRIAAGISEERLREAVTRLGAGALAAARARALKKA